MSDATLYYKIDTLVDTDSPGATYDVVDTAYQRKDDLLPYYPTINTITSGLLVLVHIIFIGYYST